MPNQTFLDTLTDLNNSSVLKPNLPEINTTLPLLISLVCLGLYLIAIFYAEKKQFHEIHSSLSQSNKSEYDNVESLRSDMIN